MGVPDDVSGSSMKVESPISFTKMDVELTPEIKSTFAISAWKR
jgi:hypothetical protein